MAEMILPGTYIEVRAEKLISAGPIAIGNVGVVGTARRGKLNTVYIPSNIGEARDVFGQSDAFDAPEDAGGQELTLIRALELAFANGAQRVFAVRVANESSATTASFSLAATTGTVTLTAVAPGNGYDDAELVVGPDPASSGSADVSFTLGTVIEGWREVPLAVAEFAQVINGTHPTYNYRSLSSNNGGSNIFNANAGAATGDVTVDTANDTVAAAADSGSNGANAGLGDYQDGLAVLSNEDVHIVVAPVAHDPDNPLDITASISSHVENASSDLMRRERIAIVGSNPSATHGDLVAPDRPDGRLVFVGPGVQINDSVSERIVSLPGTYAAAALAGRISSLDPQVSPTNKTLNVEGLETVFNGTILEQLLLGRVMALESRNGAIRIVRGITSSTNTAWAQVTTRRIVDFARFGVRSAANPFIGKLNNERVRQAMKGSINGFMADMVDREMLISYELEVSATREQEIRGIAQVTMVVRPTFSIDYIRVIMYLE